MAATSELRVKGVHVSDRGYVADYLQFIRSY